MALIVPTVVGTLALTAYDPGEGLPAGGSDGDEDFSEPELIDETTTEAVQEEGAGEPAEGEPAAEPDAAPAPSDEGGTTSLRRRMGSLLAGGPGLLRFDGPRILIAVPMIRRLSTFTAEEQRSLRLAPSTDLNVPLISATF
jgi:hypothetical protein